MRYQEIGLVIAVSSILLAVSTYLLLGIVPLLALWIGLLIVGISMAITPGEPMATPSIPKIVVESFENVEKILELLGLGSYTVYVPRNGGVYAYVSNQEVASRDIDSVDSSKLIDTRGGRVVLVLRVPVPETTESDVCSAISEALVDITGFAHGVECIHSGNSINLRVVNPVALGFSRIERVLGPLPVAIAAAVASRILGKATRVVHVAREGRNIVASIEVLEYG